MVSSLLTAESLAELSQCDRRFQEGDLSVQEQRPQAVAVSILTVAGSFVGVRLLIGTSLAFAEGAGEGHESDGSGEHHGHGGGFSDLIPFFVSFTVFFAFLYFVLKDVVRTQWLNRRRTISTNIESAQEKLKRAIRSYEVAEGELAMVSRRVEELRRQIGHEAELEVQGILAAAADRADLLKSEAQKSVQAEREKAVAEARQVAIDQIVEQARVRLGGALSGERDRTLRSRVILQASELNSTEQGSFGGNAGNSDEVLH